MSAPLFVRLPMQPGSPAAARRAVMRHAGLRVEPAALSNAVLLVSELVTALVEAGGAEELELGVRLSRGDLRVQARRVLPEPPASAPEGSSFSRTILEHLADAWGDRGEDGDPALWFELRGAARPPRSEQQPEPAGRRAAGVRSDPA